MNKKTVIYWVSRAIRTQENPALRFAQDFALANGHDFIVVFNLYNDFPYANLRNMDFLLRGLLEMANKLHLHAIPLILLEGDAAVNFQRMMEELSIAAIISEHQVLKPLMQAQDCVRAHCTLMEVPFLTINTSCVVPVEIASPKLEYAARTFRPKIMAQYKDYLHDIGDVVTQSQSLVGFHVFDETQYQHILDRHPAWNTVSRSRMIPGEDAAIKQLYHFIKEGLPNYDKRNEYNAKGQSMLSAYLHFGMISPVKIVREVEMSNHVNVPAYVEEVMVRRELAENYCHYCKDYDRLDGAWPWARQTLQQHRNDKHDYNYTEYDFQHARTHDDLWNFCQKQIVDEGYLHSYLRMYWAKMVLLWTPDAQTAIEILIQLNDTYMLDGRDPNGYTGIMWSVAGVHDRPWYNKPVHGLIRAMGKEGTLKKTKLKI
jgi:deoxyribodipyrimidine photo-lyase